MNPKFFRNGIVMLVLVVGTAALIVGIIALVKANDAEDCCDDLQSP